MVLLVPDQADPREPKRQGRANPAPFRRAPTPAAAETVLRSELAPTLRTAHASADETGPPAAEAVTWLRPAVAGPTTRPEPRGKGMGLASVRPPRAARGSRTFEASPYPREDPTPTSGPLRTRRPRSSSHRCPSRPSGHFLRVPPEGPCHPVSRASGAKGLSDPTVVEKSPVATTFRRSRPQSPAKSVTDAQEAGKMHSPQGCPFTQTKPPRQRTLDSQPRSNLRSVVTDIWSHLYPKRSSPSTVSPLSHPVLPFRPSVGTVEKKGEGV